MNIKFSFRFWFILFVFLFSRIHANQIEKAYKALSIHDYFKAKLLFYQVLKKTNNSAAAYGLSLIFNRNNNPFYNPDSAAKYANRSFNYYKLKNEKQTYSGITIDNSAILNLCDSIAVSAFKIILNKNSISETNAFLIKNYLASVALLVHAVHYRDKLQFNQTILQSKSDSTIEFIRTHPLSEYLNEALLLFDQQLFDEQTEGKTEGQFLGFINKYPKNRYISLAYENLFSHYKRKSNAGGLVLFVKNFLNAPQLDEAWKLLFTLKVKSYSDSEMKIFLKEFPDFPFKNTILKELELSKLNLYVFQKEDYFGFIDSTGNILIKPEYDSVTGFNEGLAVVSKNDSVFYINKENSNPFNLIFSEAFPFKNGIAAVRQNNKYCFINRQGQTISPFYDEINELSNNAYVFKLNNKFGAFNQFVQTITEPRFEKLGDFKNDFASFSENGKYGFVSKTGYIHKAEFDWISDFTENKIAIIKQNNYYGLINSNGIVILKPQFDLILNVNHNIYIPVKNSLYGFFSGNGCFLSAITFDFVKEKPPEFYTNGTLLKLLKKNREALMDFNGKLVMDFGINDEINFPVTGLYKVKRRNKFGFIDKKLNVIIPFKYNAALNFKDSIAIVRIKENNSLINTEGKEIYTAHEAITKLTRHFYLVEGEEKVIVNNMGVELYKRIENIKPLTNNSFIIDFLNNEMRIIRD